MKTTRKMQKIFTMLLGIVFALAVPQMASALNNYTAACTSIGNTATINFTVGGVGQTPGTSNTSSFTVANKINVTVVTTDVAAVSVAPGATTRTLTFSVTNNGNYTQDYTITAAAKANGTANPFGGALLDTFDGTNLGGSTTVNDLAPDGTAAVTITADIPAGQVSDDLAVYTLTATTLAADGTAIPAHNGNGAVKTAAGATACTTDFVYADGAGIAGDGDSANDAKGSARDAYKVSSAIMSFAKTATTIWDPVNYNQNTPKAIPGALIRYVITVSNGAAATSSAVLTTITDGLNANTTIDPDLKLTANNGPLTALANESAAGKGFKVVVSGSTRALNGANQYFTTTSSADGVDIAGQNITATMTTVLPAEGTYAVGELKAGESVTITFNVTIN